MTADTLELARHALTLLSDGEFDELVAMTDPSVEWHSFFGEG